MILIGHVCKNRRCYDDDDLLPWNMVASSMEIRILQLICQPQVYSSTLIWKFSYYKILVF